MKRKCVVVINDSKQQFKWFPINQDNNINVDIIKFVSNSVLLNIISSHITNKWGNLPQRIAKGQYPNFFIYKK